MREILFRAKTESGRWIEGDLIHYQSGEVAIIEKPFFKYGYEATEICRRTLILHDTICQYTGITDKNGNKIWENDIIEFEDTGEEGYEYKEGYDFINRAKVEFAEARWSLTDFIDTNSAVVDEMYNHIEFMDFWKYCEVIGNTFDNADLLKGE